jgi:hypothetical protein
LYSHHIGASFSLEPTSVTQAEGVVAKFLCRHPQTVAFGWMINGTALTLIEPRPPEIQDGSVLLSDGMDGLVSTEALNITALPGVSIHWTGPLDWTTGLTFDPKILTKNGRFALIGGPRMPSLLSYSFSGREDIKCMLDQAFM